MIKMLEHLEGCISEHFKIGKKLLTLIKLEAKLARLSIFPLVLNICMLMVILMSVWFSGMVLLGYYIAVSLGSFALAMSLILAINFILFLLLIKYLSFNLKNMSFINTREFFSTKEQKGNELTKKDDPRDIVDNKPIKKSTASIKNT